MPKPKIKPSSRNRFTVYLTPEIRGLLSDAKDRGLSFAIRQSIERYHELLHGTRSVRACRRLEGLDE